MELGLTKEFLLLLAVWAFFAGALIIFLKGSSWGSFWADRLLGITPPLESLAADPNEKRLYPRKRLPLTVDYSVLERPECQGTALSRDISKGGVCIPLTTTLPAGSRLRLTVQLPRGGRLLDIWGKVIWQAPRKPTPRLLKQDQPLPVWGNKDWWPSATTPAPKKSYETGIHFIQLSPSHIITISHTL